MNFMVSFASFARPFSRCANGHDGKLNMDALRCGLLLLSVSTTISATDSYMNCIVGAGPGGLQLGRYMLEAKRDYAIFERAERAGAFFERYPRHRKLISINKRFTVPGRGRLLGRLRPRAVVLRGE